MKIDLIARLSQERETEKRRGRKRLAMRHCYQLVKHVYSFAYQITQEFIKIYVQQRWRLLISRLIHYYIQSEFGIFIINWRRRKEREIWRFTIIAAHSALKLVSIIIRIIRHARRISTSRGRVRRKKWVSDTEKKNTRVSRAIHLREYRLSRYIHQRSFNADAQWSRSVSCTLCIVPVIDGRPNKRAFLRMYVRKEVSHEDYERV